MPKAKRLTDAQLVKLGREYLEVKARTEELDRQKREIAEQISAELALRDDPTVEAAGLKITRKRKRKDLGRWNVEALRAVLSPAQRKAVFEERVKASEVAALVKAGAVATETVTVDGQEVVVVAGGAEVVEWSDPYIDVTVKREQGVR